MATKSAPGKAPGPRPSRKTIEEPPEEVPPPPPPPAEVWPCGCPYPHPHQTDCMWSMWEQMRDNYQQTKSLMGKFMNQVDQLQGPRPGQLPCQCPPGCHGTDLGEAMGLQQMQGVTVPWLGLQQPPGLQNVQPPSPPEDYSVKSENRKLLEEQKRVKSTWVQFLNIFDMALNLANDVSKDRCEAMKRRKEREHLERKQRREEACRERQERRERCTDERTKSQESEGSQSQNSKSDEKKKKASQGKSSREEEPSAAARPEPEATREPEPEPSPEPEPEPQAEPAAEAEAEGEE